MTLWEYYCNRSEISEWLFKNFYTLWNKKVPKIGDFKTDLISWEDISYKFCFLCGYQIGSEAKPKPNNHIGLFLSFFNKVKFSANLNCVFLFYSREFHPRYIHWSATKPSFPRTCDIRHETSKKERASLLSERSKCGSVPFPEFENVSPELQFFPFLLLKWNLKDLEQKKVISNKLSAIGNDRKPWQLLPICII